MNIARQAGAAPRTTDLAQQIDALSQPCVGCTECQGICAALIDTLTIPDLVLKPQPAGRTSLTVV